MKVVVHDNGTGTGSVVMLDGKNVAGSVRSLQIDAGARTIPRLTLDVMIFYGLEFEGDADVAVSAETRDLLIKLGWTPPAER